MKNAGVVATVTETNAPHHPEPRPLVRIVGVASGSGAPDPRCGEGSAALRKDGLISRLRHAGLDAAWSTTIQAPAGVAALTVVSTVAEILASRTEELVARGRVPVVLGGDHSCAIGTWKGVARALAPRPLGLIWIDAHMDGHTAQTSSSGKIHGMPLACLLGEGDSRLTGIAGGTRLDPRRVCVVGVRSFEPGEAALMRQLGVRVFLMHEVARRGLHEVMKDAFAIAGSAGGPYGISLDLDALDPRDAPGVGSPVAGGIRGADLRRSLARCAHDRALACLEVVEFNPHRDRDGATARLAADLIQAALAPRALRSVSPAPAPCNAGRYTASANRRRAA